MRRGRSTAESDQRFRDSYRGDRPAAEIRLERLVFGSDLGVSGWTTTGEADELARRMRLGKADRLLDIGSGRGWPGLHLARTTGCDVVLSDQPVEALQHAVVRGRREKLGARCSAVAASAAALPFREGSFDAVVHTDVLC